MHLRPAPDGTQEEELVEPVGPLWYIKYDEKWKRDCKESGNATIEDKVVFISGNDQGGAKDPIDKQDDGAYQAKELERVVNVCKLNNGQAKAWTPPGNGFVKCDTRVPWSDVMRIYVPSRRMGTRLPTVDRMWRKNTPCCSCMYRLYKRPRHWGR